MARAGVGLMAPGDRGGPGRGPSVLCIGAQKAGTTWLYRAFHNRNDCWLPPIKELHYWDEKFAEPRSWFEQMRSADGQALRWRRQIRNERTRRSRIEEVTPVELERRRWSGQFFFDTPSLQWYLDRFPADQPSFDITPEYALLDADRIREVVTALPDVRVVYLLRHPIEREWSAAQMRYRANKKSLDSVLAGRHRHARYAQHIDRWSEALAPGRLYVGFFDDIVARPHELFADIARFVGANPKRITLPPGRPNSGNVSTIPAEFAVALAHKLEADIDELAQRYPGAATTWAEIAAWLRLAAPTGDLPYPFEVPGVSDSLGLSSAII